jgi:hypothetical protein
MGHHARRRLLTTLLLNRYVHAVAHRPYAARRCECIFERCEAIIPEVRKVRDVLNAALLEASGKSL